MEDTNLIAALAPAFAAGFAVQRVIEIVDPLIDSRLSATTKKGFLGLLSLGLGLLLAWGLGLQVLAHLGITSAQNPHWLTFLLPGLDYFVTGLIISAGTEGFNSLLKFLEYRKEEQKAESVKESLNVSDTLLSRSLEAEDLIPMSANLTLPTPGDVMKKALQDRVRVFTDNPGLALDFKNGKFNQHMVSDLEAQVVALEATANAAQQFKRVLNSKGKKIVRQSITLNTGYGAAVNVMREAIAKGADLAGVPA